MASTRQGDELVIDGGTLRGLQVGRNFVVRRTYRVEWDPRDETGEHTAGLIQIVAADEQTSAAVVIYACDEIVPGDRLASFKPEPLRAPAPAGTPDYRHAARILFPDVGQLVGAPRRMMVIDRGAASGVRSGSASRCSGAACPAAARRSSSATPSSSPFRRDSATIRVEHATDAIVSGDMAALQRR